MSNINKIKVSGQTYSIQDLNATKTVELTQAEYDVLPATAKTSNSLFIITDAQGADLSNYYTKTEADNLLDTKLDVTAYTPTDLTNYYTKSETSGATEISTALASKADTATTYTKTETDNAITAATSAKQDTLVSGTNIKTINSQSILGEGNITIEGGGGGSITVDTSLDSGSTNAVANSAITNAINSKMDEVNFANFYGDQYSAGLKGYYYDSQTDTQTEKFHWGMVWQSDGSIGFDALGNLAVFNKIDTSAITTSVTSSSTDSQVPSAKAVYDMVGNINTILESI